ncbi:hypothetical protein RHABOEDO_001640 [Candidatus Rhabdochlamydia oedothoracis]|uniref:Transposase n=1 Tax=Candidatus Rhabdochlamydia oedothoracis TaxID=2720720 RepID=A0ABX8V252_9BACT|nr:hypothetical protein RHABOEDO_001640 [Candidatus Rhabdochlamydia oedothoracis]
MSQAMEKLRKKTTYKPEYGDSCFYCSTFEKILNRLLDFKAAIYAFFENIPKYREEFQPLLSRIILLS